MDTNKLVVFPHFLVEENSFEKIRNPLIWILLCASTSALLPETETA